MSPRDLHKNLWELRTRFWDSEQSTKTPVQRRDESGEDLITQLTDISLVIAKKRIWYACDTRCDINLFLRNLCFASYIGYNMKLIALAAECHAADWAVELLLLLATAHHRRTISSANWAHSSKPSAAGVLLWLPISAGPDRRTVIGHFIDRAPHTRWPLPLTNLHLLHPLAASTQ